MLKRHYDKVIVGCCFLFLFANLGMASTAFSVHQPYIVAIEGVGDTGGSLILSVRTATSLAAMFFVDRYYRLFDVRKGVFLATMATTVGFVVYSFAHALPVFMGGAVFMGFGYGLGGMVAVTYIANRWFGNKLGSMVGFASMGSGLATIVMPLVVMRLIEATSLSVAFLCEAGLTAAIGVLMLLVLRNRPEDIGMVRTSETPENAERKNGKKKQGHRAMRPAPAAEHVVLMLAMIGVGIFSCCGGTYISVLATSTGYSPLLAATLVSVLGIALTIAKFITGELFDHLGVAAGTAIVFGLGIAGYGLCSLAGLRNPFIMMGGAVLVGVGMSLGSVGVSVWSIDLSNPSNRVKEIRNFQVAYSIGGFIANTLPGILKDLAGSYVVSYAAILVVAAVAAFLILRYYHRYSIRPS